MVHPIIFFVINLSEDKEKTQDSCAITDDNQSDDEEIKPYLGGYDTNLWTKYYAIRSVSTELRVWPLILKGNVNRGF